jgi:hypothetical protein
LKSSIRNWRIDVSYIGGLGAGKGWHKTHFLVEAEELSELLSQERLSLVNTSGWVPRRYIETSLGDYLSSYRRYLEQLRVDPTPAWAIMRDLSISLMASRDILDEDECNDPEHKLLRHREPVIHIAELSVVCVGDRLLVDIMSKDPGYLGLSMTFPRLVSYGAERHQWLHPTDHLLNGILHEKLRTAVMETAGPLSLCSGQKRQRTRVRVSTRCKAWLDEHAYLRRHGLTTI